MEAQYGKMVADVPGAERYPLMAANDGDDQQVIDVKVPLQALVNDSQLRIYTGKVTNRQTKNDAFIFKLFWGKTC